MSESANIPCDSEEVAPGTLSFIQSRVGLPGLLFVVIVILDQLSKYLVLTQWPIGSNHVVIRGFFNLVHLRNTGAAWGMFRGQSQILAALSILVFAFIIWKFHHLSDHFSERAVALGLILGGIGGNLIDRVLHGEVVDFLLFYYRSFQWPAFNVADSAICVGVAIFVISSLFRDFRDASTTSPDEKEHS